MLVVSERALTEHGLTPRARIHHLSVRGDDPILMLAAPIPATAYALKKSGMSLDDVDLIEINEAFAPVVLAWQQETGADLVIARAISGVRIPWSGPCTEGMTPRRYARESQSHWAGARASSDGFRAAKTDAAA